MKQFLFRRKPVFTVAQFARLSNIFDNAGQVIFGVAVLTQVLSGFDKINWLAVLLGGIFTVSSWVLSVWLTKKGTKR